MDDMARNHATTSRYTTPQQSFDWQRISVIMANFNGQAHIRRAIESVLGQTYRNLELIVSDDASSDESSRIVREMMSIDDRVRLIVAKTTSGPAGARNRALQAASGDWIAIVDSDDLIHPERLARMRHSAVTLHSDLVADDLIFFGDDPSERHRTLLQDLYLSQPEDIDALALIDGRVLGRRATSLGYLKPLIRRGAIGDTRYNEELRVDEDHDFYLRLLLGGAKFTLIPDALYLYRRHAASVSHRFNAAKLQPMVRVQEKLLEELAGHQEDLCRALARRIGKHIDQLQYARTVEAIQSERYANALWLLMRHPRSWALLLTSLRERALRKRHRHAPARIGVKLILCLPGVVAPEDCPGSMVVHVPDVPDAGWAPSSARTWSYLAHLSSKHDLDITAIDRPGAFALGLVPRFRSAQVVGTRDDLDAAIMPEQTESLTSGAELSTGNA